jgi:hypothetical protein
MKTVRYRLHAAHPGRAVHGIGRGRLPDMEGRRSEVPIDCINVTMQKIDPALCLRQDSGILTIN